MPAGRSWSFSRRGANCTVSRELIEDTQVELQQVQDLLARHRALLVPPAGGEGPVQTMALAALLHSFYTGIENVFRRIGEQCDGGLPSGAAWHRELLDSMAQATPARGAVISEGTRDRLEEYLRFRHLFRHAYTLQLDARKLEPLATGCIDTFDHLASDVRRFLESLG